MLLLFFASTTTTVFATGTPKDTVMVSGTDALQEFLFSNKPLIEQKWLVPKKFATYEPKMICTYPKGTFAQATGFSDGPAPTSCGCVCVQVVFFFWDSPTSASNCSATAMSTCNAQAQAYFQAVTGADRQAGPRVIPIYKPSN